MNDDDVVGRAWTNSAAVRRARAGAISKAESCRRPLVDPTTCEKDYSVAEVEFANAMERYKVLSGRRFPTNSEVLEVLACLGYRKVMPSGPLPGER